MASGEGRDHAASVRAGPSAGYARIAKLPIEVEACRARWCLIDRGDVEGWVSAKLIGRYRPVQDTTVIVEIVPRMPRWRGPGQVMGPGPVRSPNFNPPNLPDGLARPPILGPGPVRPLWSHSGTDAADTQRGRQHGDGDLWRHPAVGDFGTPAVTGPASGADAGLFVWRNLEA
ncbi:SH3 domain-containing protein [Mesorhizobium escarrei]|uniref:SH3 domain-containing protein n=1 Tax=Mesorhizobium escarrei TaxID=666018 RepID=A0ABN8JLJ8_9HYPH|nr:SH3 domain-containing protein [Mesorhizobium escarrei]CAH2398067.1 hypothetical protein MES5069_190031 [Mesorhizobium escarrei]